MKLLLCIPAYNEAEVIIPTLKAVTHELALLPGVVWHVVVADNGSTDGTAEQVQKFGHPNVSVINVPKKGKGIAIRTAAVVANDADMFGFIDADLSAHPSSIPLLVDALAQDVDIAIGSRLLHPSHVKRGALRTASSMVFNFLRHKLLGVEVEDSQCGLKIMNRRGVETLLRCTEDGWFLDIEFLARAQKAGLRIVEVPIAWDEYHYHDRASKLSLWRDGLEAFRALWRIRKKIHTS